MTSPSIRTTASPRTYSRLARPGMLLALLLLVAAQPVVVSAQCCTPCATVRPQDSIWLVDARSGCFGNLDDAGAGLRYFTHSNGGWQRGSRQAFFDPEQAVLPTVVWVHGDRVESGEAYATGMRVYLSLIATRSDPAPVRFVIYSWPTSRQFVRPLKDARLKQGYTTTAGYRLGWLVSELPAETPVSLIGYSYGSRVITAGLHFLGGGEIGRWALTERQPGRAAPRVTLLAPAVENGLIIPGRGHGLALSVTERMLVLRNSADAVLRLYPRVNGAAALGSVGLAERCLGRFAERFDQRDVACYVGRQHHWESYFASSAVRAQIEANLLMPVSIETADQGTTALAGGR